MGSLMKENIGDTCKTYNYLTNTSWKYVLSFLLLLEPANSKKSIRYNLHIPDTYPFPCFSFFKPSGGALNLKKEKYKPEVDP